MNSEDTGDHDLDGLDTEYDRQRRAAKLQYDLVAYDNKVRAFNKQKAESIELVRRLDSIKTNWYEWEATRGDVTGIVQADYSGELIADETFKVYD